MSRSLTFAVDGQLKTKVSEWVTSFSGAACQMMRDGYEVYFSDAVVPVLISWLVGDSCNHQTEFYLKMFHPEIFPESTTLFSRIGPLKETRLSPIAGPFLQGRPQKDPPTYRNSYMPEPPYTVDVRMCSAVRLIFGHYLGVLITCPFTVVIMRLQGPSAE